MLFSHQAECPYCHAQLLVPTTVEVMTAEELSLEAIEICTCPEARLSRSMNATERKLETVLGENSISRGFNYAATNETMDAVREICRMILMGAITGKVTLCIPGGDKLQLSEDKSAVKIKRSTNRQLEI